MRDIISMLSAGDIILVRSNGFISKGIRFFMERYRRKLGLKKRVLFNHAAHIVEYKGEKYVAEANKMGIEVNLFSDRYLDRLEVIKIITPKKKYTGGERGRLSDAAISDSFNPTRYDFLNFFYQIKMIRKTNKVGDKNWNGPTGNKAQKRLYCSEAVATWANKVRPNTFEKPWSVNPLDIDLNRYYKVLYNGIKG